MGISWSNWTKSHVDTYDKDCIHWSTTSQVHIRTSSSLENKHLKTQVGEFNNSPRTQLHTYIRNCQQYTWSITKHLLVSTRKQKLSNAYRWHLCRGIARSKRTHGERDAQHYNQGMGAKLPSRDQGRVRGSGEQAPWSWKSFNHCVPSESRKLHHYLYFANSQTPRYLWYISKTRRYHPQRWTALCVSRISIWSCTACGVQSKLAQNITNILAQTVMKETQNHNSIILVQGRPSPKANEEKVVCITKILFEYCPLWICHWQ